MRTSCAVVFLALLDASSAHAGSVIGALINGSGARFSVRNCGGDACGMIAWGRQKFVVRRSDVPSIFKDLEPKNKQVSSKRETAVIVDPPRSPAAALPSGTQDRTSAPKRSEDATVVRTDERSTPPSDAVRSAPAESNDAAPPAAIPPAVKTVTDAPVPSSPIGTWIAEHGEGRVRIDPCGEALCGVVATAYPGDTDVRNPDPGKRNRPLLGVPVLIDMKPSGKERWQGQVYSAKSGYTYAATIALKNADVLRVDGCVFGGLFCNSQAWTRDKDASAP
jgi:uncharacterized protein (DUF2147 family)